MRLILSLAAGAALAACSQTNQDNTAVNADVGVDANVGETVLPADDASGETDTLGNQLNQLNDSGAVADNSSESNSN